MAHARRSHHHRAPSLSIHTSTTVRKDTLKRVRGRLAPDASPEAISSPLPRRLRLPLVTLQPNHRRQPFGTRNSTKDKVVEEVVMRELGHVTGSKRKRMLSGNENANERSTRGVKRPRVTTTRTPYNLSASEESESEQEEMEIDLGSTQGTETDDSDVSEEQVDNEDEEAEEEDEDSSDDFYIYQASHTCLSKLLKRKLVELYELAGFTESAESLRKSELIDALIGAREDGVSIPPSSPGRADASSEYQSSDDGHFAGDEETDAHARHPTNGRQLLRRATVHDVVAKATAQPKYMKSRSASLGNILGNGQSSKMFLEDVEEEDKPTRRRTSARTSPTSSGSTAFIHQSPPNTRLRSRATSASVKDVSLPNSSSSKNKGKGKSKQVEFSNAVEVHLRTPPKQTSKGKKKEPSLADSDSDLTSLDELEANTGNGDPSPRRLRSQDREDRTRTKEIIDLDATPIAPGRQRSTRNVESDVDQEEISASKKTRITPMRKAKRNKGNLRESEGDEENVEDDDLLAETEGDEDGNEEVDEEEEVDELVSSRSTSRSMSPPPQRKKPRRARRKRPARVKPLPTGEEENEGDDEEEEVQEALEEEEDGEDGEGEGEDDSEDQAEEEDIAVEPRKLRNGKIVGEEADEEEEEDVDEMDIDESVVGEEEEGEDGEDVEDVENESVEGSEIDVDGESDAEEVMEDDDIDLALATAKTLVRLRRDDLVRLCESRAIDPSGTKPQLAEALLHWRDRQTNDFSSPSSTGTVRPWSNRRRKRTRKDSTATTTNSDVPVLLRSQHVHLDEPRTPPLPSKEKDNEDLELDLESLGLEDREIPPDKLTKLEKIGSGGFKDVFIGKFKGRKVAIAEFRGQLSAMDIKELKLLGEFNHPNIVRFMGVSIPENTRDTPVMIISELCSNGDLFDYVRNVSAPNLRKVVKLMLDIARGLEYLHKRTPSVIHRDCKSSNILITARGSAKIADFGLAKVKQSTRSMVRSLVGTVNWQAPELWNAHPKYNHKVDVFSCAMVFWEMLQWHQPAKKFPWEGMNEHAIYELVGSKRQRPSISGLKRQWCPEIVELMENMWAQEPHDRPTMTDVVETLEEIFSHF